ncbi:PREDICTED: PHD finger protein 20 isoform X3 [Trachymyrmex septentrionalis]|uniref:PHD finger protein 20 isoform X3 n=1 Tax=Trachymyrmex septentrionalis TaxID=34720 RepID=UPI00084F6502|nr:PREDICTED: PHD finger protein 20 isoform X3 [Trachymyrmex septentrionalis]
MKRRIPRSHIEGRVSSAVTAAAATAASAATAGAMGMARKCCVDSCKADVREARAKGLPLHKFPKDITLRDRWLASGGFETGFKPTPGQVVCHRHFKRADYETARGGHKLLLKRGSVPTIFADYDDHPDPVIMSVKSSTSYAQEDLDLINSEILNLEHSASPLLSEARTPKSDSCGETCYSRPESSADSLNLLDNSEITDNEYKIINSKEERKISEMDKPSKNSDNKVNTVAMQLGIVEPETEMKTSAKDLIAKEELKLSGNKEFDKSEELKPKVLNRGDLKFFPGAKLEAKDFNDKWYSAKVVETDWDEREVLIHFDKWSSRFDEWIPMDSSRLRVLQTPQKEVKMKEFSVGERILATWADGKKYPAKVSAVLTNDRYNVLFDDGYAKIVKSLKMTKIAGNSKQLNELDGYIGSKQERRDKKRKHTVMELFNTHSRKRTKQDIDKTPKKEETVIKESGEISSENKIEMDGTQYGPCYDPGTDLLKGFETNPSKIKSYSKKSKKEVPKVETDQVEENVGPEWIDGEPQGTESYIVDGNDGPRRSIIVPDKRLPPGWEKHFTQRKAGSSAGKWDVLFIHKQTGKKFRSRNDIRIFMENQGQYDFDPEKFDFCIHRRKRNHPHRVKQEVASEVTPKKIKTLLPKTKTPENTLLTTVTTNIDTAPITSMPTTSTTDGEMIYSVFIGLRGGLRVEMEDNAYKCPKEGCNKNFRKENLLQMHIKHYHPEYSKFLGSTPKVEDLAYARTIGESIEDIIPKKPMFMEKMNKSAKKKSLPEKSPSTLLQSTLNTMQPTSPSIPGPVMPEEEEMDQLTKYNDSQKEDMKIETMSPISNHSIEIDEDIEKKRENVCALSPGTLFDMKIKEEKAQGGIKTLLPVRPVAASEVQRTDRTKPLDDMTHGERAKNQKKRLTEYNVDLSVKTKKRHGMSDLTDSFGDLDDSAMDVEGPTALMYRYSRRKSDSKSDENSQNSQLNDSRIDKADPLKGDAIKTDINNDAEESEGVMMMINGELVKVEQLRREEIINCTCGFMEEDGLMIQCDLCLCWQHGHCNFIEKEKDVPEKYICYICRNPHRQRPSKKYFHDQDWIKEGKLPSLPNRTRNQYMINQRTAMLKRSYDLVAALLQIQQLLHSLRVKINVAQKKDHPKLYLWAKNWEKMDMSKIDIEPVPVMEITKAASFTDTGSEIPRRVETKTDIKLSKDDQDEKSIASDSELMKILEEDSTHSDESRIISKKEGLMNSKDSHILLNALTSSTSDIKEKDITTSDIKAEEADLLADKTIIDNPVPENLNSGSLIIDNIQQETSITVENEVSALPQPFIPEPEAPIDPAECRMRLLEHIEHFQCHIDSRLTSIETQIFALETMDPDELVSDPLVQPRTKQTVQMLLRDLNTVRKLAALC